MKFTRQAIGILIFIIAVIAVVTLIFTVVYLLTGALYELTGQQPSGVVVNIINTVLGLILSALILPLIGRLVAPRQQAEFMAVFGPILDAMGRIAKGDFSVQVEHEVLEGSGPVVTELAKSVNSMALELNQMEQMRQEFISNVSHEIQSPLTSIRGFAKALQKDDLNDADRAHYLSIIETESTRLSRLTDNLLKLASLEAKQVKFEPKPYRLDKQLRDLILACEPQWQSKALEMEVALAEMEVTADEDLMSQVWMNLLANSIKFTPDGGRICVGLQCRDGKVEFKISDTGIGIPEADQSRIFERFYKADKPRTHAANGGSGLGLSIAQKIVEMHQGTIAVESKAGAGTTFTVRLPSSR
jgi:signal transduction histidine kinase